MPPWYDIAFYLHRSMLAYEQYLKNGIAGLFCYFIDKNFIGGAHAPLLQTVTGIVFAATRNNSIQTAYLSMAIYTYIFLSSIFLICIRYFNKETAVWALFIFLTFPVVIEYSRTFLPYYPLGAFCTLAIFFLLKSNRFLYVKYSLLFGLSYLLVLLTKTYGLAHLLTPTFVVFLLILRSSEHRPRRLILFLITMTMVISLASLWYIHGFRSILNYLAVKTPPQVILTKQEGTIWNLENWTSLIKRIITWDFSFYYTLLLVVLGLGWVLHFVRNKRNLTEYKDICLITASLLIGLYIFLSIPKFDASFQYSQIVAPIVAICLAALVTKIENRVFKYVCSAIVLVVGSTNYIILQTGILQNQKLIQLGLSFSDRPCIGWYKKYEIKSYSDWSINELITVMAADMKSQHKQKIDVYLPFEHHYFYVGNFIYYSALRGLRNSIAYHLDSGYPGLPDWDDVVFIKNRFKEMDYVIVKTGKGGIADFQKFGKMVLTVLEDHPGEFVRIHEQGLPDGSSAVVYKRLMHSE